MSRFFVFLVCFVAAVPAASCFGFQEVEIEKFSQEDKFRQLEEILPTPNDHRTASGDAGHQYWQQAVDYEIDVRIDDEQQHLHGSEKITYKNKSTDHLSYLWLQLDANIREPHSDGNLARTTDKLERLEFRAMRSMLAREEFEGGLNITSCEDCKTSDKLKFTIVKTMMRVDLPEKLAPGDSFRFQIDWDYKINNSKEVRGRTGCEFFEKDGNYICLLYTSPCPRDATLSRMPSSA